MLTMDGALLLADGMPKDVTLDALLKRFADDRNRMDNLKQIYDREHDIKHRVRLKGLPNHKLVHDLPGYIVAVTSGYLVGRPVQYKYDGAESDFAPMLDALSKCDAGSVDSEIAQDAAIYGKGVCLLYADAEAKPRIAQADPRASFVVYDNTVAHEPLFGVTLREICSDKLERLGEIVTVLTATQVVEMERKGTEPPHEIGREPHFFGGVPLIEFWNNPRESGDFEGVMSLIDAYDEVQSDRVNDKQQYTDALLVLKGVGTLTADDAVETEGEEQEGDTMTPSERLRKTRTLYLPGDAGAEYITKQLSESDTEVLKDSLKADIHKLSFVPDLTDEQFAGVQSGVAMRYKLYGLEQLTQIKERWFREGLMERLERMAHFLALQGAPVIDPDKVTITFSRALPVNDGDAASVVKMLDGMVSLETLLSQLPFVDDPKAEAEKVRQEADEKVQRQQQAMEAVAYPEITKKDKTAKEDKGDEPPKE